MPVTCGEARRYQNTEYWRLYSNVFWVAYGMTKKFGQCSCQNR